jgi:transcriptional regulator with XRE-family HTH domain
MDDADERTLRFAEIVRYAQKVLGGASGRASQRDLAAALGLAPTMVGRYLSANADFHHLRAITIERLAAAAQLEPGALFVWIREGRSAAMAYQQLMQQQPVAFEPIDLARQLVAMLDSGDPAVPAGAVEPMEDYGALQQDIADQRAVAPAMFDRLVAMADAAATVEKVNGSAALLHSDWLKLQQLLDAPALELMQRYGFAGHATAKTPLLRA